MKKILIAGATGFIGSHLVKKLIQNNFELIILKRSYDKTDRIEKYLNSFKIYDIDKEGIERAFKENKVDMVINLVTNYGRDEQVLVSEIAETNILFGLKLIETAIKGHAKIYFNIDSSLKPEVNLYAYTKKVLKEIIKKYLADKIKIINLQLEYVYGENDDLSKFIPFAIEKLRNNEELKMSKGEQELDFIYVRDCVGAIAHIIKNADKYEKGYEEFEIGTGKTTSLKNFVEAIKKELHSKSKIDFGGIPYRENEQMYSKADIKKLQPWQPKYSMDEAIKKIIFNRIK